IDVETLPLHRVRATVDPRIQGAFFLALSKEVASIRKLLIEKKIDVVQVMGLVNPHAAMAARREKRAVVWQLVDTRAPRLVRAGLMPMVLRWSDVVMSTGQKVADAHPGSRRLGSRLRLFVPPVNVSEFKPNPAKRAAARRELGIPS